MFEDVDRLCAMLEDFEEQVRGERDRHGKLGLFFVTKRISHTPM